MANLVDRAFWQGRRVFLTGHTGFKGAWLALWLRDMGAIITGFALPPSTEPNLFEITEAEAGITHNIGDLRASDAVMRTMRAAEPEIVFHLGAQSLVRPSYSDPVGTFATNVMGTVHLLDAALRLNEGADRENRGRVRAVVVVTSDKCYQNNEWVWGYRENEPLGGHDPYSSSKAAAELVTAAYRASFCSAPHAPLIASARAGNVIGGGDWATDRLVPDAVRAFASGERLEIRHPTAVRPWQHVLEPLAGYLMLGQALIERGAAFAEAWNFGPDSASERSVSDVVDKLAQAFGIGWEVARAVQLHEAHFLKLDSSKARVRLGWIPRLSFEEAVALTVEWYLAHRRGDRDLRGLTLSQIQRYMRV